MKKFLAKIISLITAVVISTTVLSGCALIVTDAEKDMALVVATVSLDNDLREDVIKRDMVSAYTSNAYYYQYYGTSNADAYEEIMTSLTQNLIVVQQSMKALVTATEEAGNTEKGYFLQASEILEENRTSKEKVLAKNNWEGNLVTTVNYAGYKDKDIYGKLKILDDYLTEYEYALAHYNALLTINDFIVEFVEQEESKTYSYETLKVTNRATLTAPTDLNGNEYELKYDEEISKITESYKKSVDQISKKHGLGIVVNDTDTKYDLALRVYKTFVEKFDITSIERKKALTRVISQLKKIGYIKANETSTPATVADLFTSNSFFASVLKTEYESLIVSKYKMALINQQEKQVTTQNLYAEYATLFESQKIDFKKSSANYEAKLESTDANSYIAYHPNYNKGTNYGYVANLLIGFNKEQQALVDAYEENVKYTEAEKLAYRDSMLKYITAKDLRQTWVLSNLGEYSEGKFTFGNDYVKTDALKVFGGTISGATPYTYLDGEDEKTAYTYKAVGEVEIPFDTFINGIFKDVLGVTASTTQITTIPGVTSVDGVIDDATMDKFRDLIYAFSTDSGSLAENYGYLYSPMGTNFVKEFENCQKELIAQGVGSMKICVTRYGYHIMLCTKVITPTASEDPMTLANFESQIGVEGSMPYEFREYKISNLSSVTVTDIVNSFIAKNSKKDGVVERFEKRYSDLIEA